MSKKLQLIQKKAESIKYGLLRFTEGAEPQSLQVSASFNNEDHLNCVIKDNDPGNPTLLNKEVSLIQKNEDDYLYITGHIEDEGKTGKVVSLKIVKACWFIRKRKGNTVWLQEKYIYQSPSEKIVQAS